MASQGPLYPATVTTEIGPSGDNDWLNASNVGADDGSEAQITAATYDANDHSYRLKARNLGFSVSGTIDGIVVEIERRAFAGAAEDQEVRLSDAAGTLVGDDKQKATAWPSTATIDTYGTSTDTWNAGLTAADINDPDFGVALIVLATAANTDIGVDFIRATITYTAAADTALAGSAGGGSAADSILGTAISLAGSLGGSATAVADLTTAIALAGAAPGSSAGDGLLTTAIRLAGLADGLSSPSAALATVIALAGMVPGTSTVGGSLTAAYVGSVKAQSLMFWVI